ncbi:MAG: protein kinase [Alphaproteobacteria bacterium]|nr:protein kinase [Alphaproteobacteria bacterium]
MSIQERYEILRLLGAGASGLVHEARDRRLGGRVALKRLRTDGPTDAAKLKREFRTLADVVHPNLVRLHALLQDDESVLVMDLVEGTTFLHWVLGVDPPDAQGTSGRTWSSDGDSDVPDGERVREPLDDAALDRLRTALGGLARGLSALHAAGLLHRDLKPGNVLVTDVGHVVVVDFGLATNPGVVQGLAGTVAYMSPEQVREEALDEASDWYAVGVMLFEALVGRPPFVGAATQVLWDKSSLEPPRVAELQPSAPADLAELCDRLLARDRRARPSGDQVCERLGVEPSRALGAVPFVGREEELRRLQAAWRSTGLRVVTVSGASGLGKTRLVESFVESLEQGALLLASRCYEREQSPYKLVDPLVEALAATLAREPVELLPGGLASASRLFPALARFVDAAATPPPVSDPIAERRRAVEGVRGLLRLVCARRPTVVWIDDLQWGDEEGARLLQDLLATEPPLDVLVVLGARSDDPRAEEVLAPLASVVTDRIELRPLGEGPGRALVRSQHPDVDDDTVERVLREAGGSPFFLAELARFVAGPQTGAMPLLGRVLESRLGQLEPTARLLLEVVAVASRPIAAEVALPAARQLVASTRAGELTALRVARLLTTRRGSDLECTHDRIRETVVSGMLPDTFRAIHRALATELGEGGEPEHLVEHWECAGEPHRAAVHAVRAARRAESALAYRRAAELYRRALRLGVEDAADVEVALGRSMARAGLGEAADVLLRASAALPVERRRTLEWEAVHEMLRRGWYRRAFSLLPEVLAPSGQRWPTSPLAMVAEVLWNDLMARLPARSRPGDEDVLRVTSELAMSVSYADMLRAAVFSSRAIRVAERLGDPASRALAAAMRGSNMSMLGRVAASDEWVARSRERMSAELSAVDRARIELHHGVAAGVVGRWDEAVRTLRDVVAALEPLGGHHYEIGMARTFQGYALMQAGRLAEFRRLHAEVIADAEERGDRFLEVLFRVSFGLQPGLLDDDPDATERSLRVAERLWSEEGTGTAWWYLELTRAQVWIYRGRNAEALAHVEGLYPQARRAGVLRINLNAVVTQIVRASASAPLAIDGDGAARKVLADAVRQVRKVPQCTAGVTASTWSAALRLADGDHAGAVQDTREAIGEERAVGIPWVAQLLQMQLASLTGGDPDVPAAALRTMGVADPYALGRLYAVIRR